MRRGFWDKRFVVQVTLFAAMVFIAEILLLHDHLVNISFIIGGFITVVTYFVFSNRFFHWWHNASPKQFERNLFAGSLILRLAAAIVLYAFYYYQTGEPFEYFAVDSKFYHENAMRIAMHFRLLNFNIAEYLNELSFSDWGFNIYLGALYSIFGPIVILPRLINTFFSSITVIMIYRTTRDIADEHAARIAGITSMLLPNFLLYLGTGLKETIMIFLVVAVMYLSVRLLLLKKITAFNILSLVFLLFSLFTFRTVLAAVMVCAFMLYGLLTSPWQNRLVNYFSIALVLTGFAYLFINSQVGNEVSQYVEKYGNVAEHMEFRATRDGGNKLAILAGVPLFMSVILMAPFPSFVYVPEQDILWMFISGNFIRNVYAYFIIAGLIYIVRYDFRKAGIIIIYTLGYLAVLANSGFALSERFHLPAVPGLIIISAIGLSQYGQGLRIWFPLYLLVAGILIIGWNYVKLTGRL